MAPKRSKYAYDMDFSHRDSINQAERDEKAKSSYRARRQKILEKLEYLYLNGLSRDRIYLLLVEKMKEAWPQCDREHIKNLINAECDKIDMQRKTKNVDEEYDR